MTQLKKRLLFAALAVSLVLLGAGTASAQTCQTSAGIATVFGGSSLLGEISLVCTGVLPIPSSIVVSVEVFDATVLSPSPLTSTLAFSVSPGATTQGNSVGFIFTPVAGTQTLTISGILANIPCSGLTEGGIINGIVSTGGGIGSRSTTLIIGVVSLESGPCADGTGGGGIISITPLISISPTLLAFAVYSGGPLPPPQTFTVSNAGVGIMRWTASILSATGGNWLTLFNASGDNTGLVTVRVTSTFLPIGTYSATLALYSRDATNSPQTLTVSLTVTPRPSLVVTASSLSFLASPGSIPPSQQLMISSSGATLDWTAATNTSSGGNWLSLSATAGTTPGTPAVVVTITGLAAGTYRGTVTVSSPDADNSPQTIPVTLTFGTPVISLRPASLQFAASVGRNPAPQTLEVQNTGTGALGWTTNVATQSGGDWLSVGPTTAVAPSTLIVTVNSAGLAVGAYTGTITIAAVSSVIASNSPQILTVLLAVDAPLVPSGGTVNAASFAPGAAVAAGSIASVFGSGLASSGSGAVSVRLNEIAAFLFNVLPGQINFQVPWELAGQSQASLTVTANGVTSSPVTVSLSPFGPGIFTAGPSGQGAVLIANTASVAAPEGAFPDSRPANRGEIISIYATGLGPVTNQPATGARASGDPPATTTTVPTVTIGNVPAALAFSGLAPGFVGLYQVNVQVPENAPTGNAVPVVLSIGGVSANTVTIAVQ